MSASLRVLAWNVYEGHAPAAVRTQLRYLIQHCSPDVIVLTEAYHLRDHLTGLGYTAYAYAPSANKETGDVSLMVRHGIAVTRRDTMVMRRRWIGPKAHLRKSPRVHRGLILRKGGQTWKVGGFHVPFGKAAVAETNRAIVRWLRYTLPRRPVIAVGDMNMSLRDLRAVVRPVRAETGGHGVDLAACRNCHLHAVKALAKHGSDHQPVLYDFVRP